MLKAELRCEQTAAADGFIEDGSGTRRQHCSSPLHSQVHSGVLIDPTQLALPSVFDFLLSASKTIVFVDCRPSTRVFLQSTEGANVERAYQITIGFGEVYWLPLMLHPVVNQYHSLVALQPLSQSTRSTCGKTPYLAGVEAMNIGTHHKRQ